MAKNIAYWEHQQGSTKFIGYSGAEMELQSGSLVDAQSGSSHKVAGKHTILSGGEFEVQSGGIIDKQSGHKQYTKGFTTHASTADGRLANYGHSVIVPTSSGIHFRLDAPVAGVDKYVTAFTSIVTHICATTASGQKSPYLGALSTDAYTIMKMTGGQIQACAGNTVHLRGMTTVRWLVMNYPSTVGCVFSTST